MWYISKYFMDYWSLYNNIFVQLFSSLFLSFFLVFPSRKLSVTFDSQINRSSRSEVLCKKGVLKNFGIGQFCETSKSIFLHRTPPDDCFWISNWFKNKTALTFIWKPILKQIENHFKHQDGGFAKIVHGKQFNYLLFV